MAITYSEIWMGKGMLEPCSPNRSDTAFGADLGAFDADNWNCLPTIVDETNSFDVSSIEPLHEVLVALMHVENIDSAGTFNFNWKFYRTAGTGDLLYEVDWEIEIVLGQLPDAWIYAHVIIGWFPQEIRNNGAAYHVDLVISDAGSHADSEVFAITNMPALSGSAGHVWVEGDYLHWIDNKERRVLGTLISVGAGSPGHKWLGTDGVGANRLCYIDADGDYRAVPNTHDFLVPISADNGHIWIQTGAFLCHTLNSYLHATEGAPV